MSDSICNFIPVKNYTGSIKTVHFVYESDFKTLKQPFLHPIYYACLVTGGCGRLTVYDNSYELEQGTLFFSFPGVPYTIDADEKFKYMYVSFMGTGAVSLLENVGIELKSCVYPGFDHLVDFWMSSITRANAKNANMLSEGVLLYTLSFIGNDGVSKQKEEPEKLFEMLVDYVDSHYRDPDISLGKLSGIFSYTEKYISYLFRTKMNIGFNRYLNNLRFQYARELISENLYSVSEIAIRCGYSDPLYFSKVFKKMLGCSPREYIKRFKSE